MIRNKRQILYAAGTTAVVGGLVGLLLFYYSDLFFSIKDGQTRISGSGIGAHGGEAGAKILPIGSDAPRIFGSDIRSGQEFSTESDLKGKVVILNFWASWCDPCLEEFPSFARLIDQYPEDLIFVGVSQDSEPEDALSFLKAFKSEWAGGLNNVFLFDEGKSFAKNYGVQALPETFILSRDNKIIHRVSGFENWDSPSAKKFFDRVLNKVEKGSL